MARSLRPIGHEDRLTLVDHLSELRRRLIISIAALLASFAFCFWQNNAILKIVTNSVTETQNLKDPSKGSKDPLEQAALYQIEQGEALRAIAPALALTGKTLRSLRDEDSLSAAQQAQIDLAANSLAKAAVQVAQAAQSLPRNTQRNLVTLGVTEPFTATITLAFYSALLLAMPLLLYQMYAFILPAFSPKERKTALPLMLMVPVLFIAGVLFGYFVVLDRAVGFLQNFNDDQFDILLQAKEFFKFAVFFLTGIGLLFQIPVGVLAVTRLGIFTPKQLAKNRGYVILGIAVLAAIATPTPDPVTMTLAMAPLIILFELSILLARWIDRIKPHEDEDDEDGLEEELEDDDEPDDDEPDDDDPLAEYHLDDADGYEEYEEPAALDLEEAAAAVREASQAGAVEAAEDGVAPQERGQVSDAPEPGSAGSRGAKLGEAEEPKSPDPKD